MIKEREIVLENGDVLIETYSDTGHYIIKQGEQSRYVSAIDVMFNNYVYVESSDYIPLDGAGSLDEINEIVEQLNKASLKINRIGLTDNEALSVKMVYPKWENYIDRTIEVGFVTLYGDNLWRARQTHTALEIYPPSLETASLYEVIVEQHSGEEDDPIPYTPPMEIFADKYYTQDGVKYLCVRDSGAALSHNLADLVGLYVEVV